ncbi:MAG TPA: FAD-dependent monooxygenase [Candidatus Dormibacteraeota bacterium]|nr:FAD-dependent monooxygenase [Candidatus Dormibacteraeota bacterium]
MLIVGAGPSGLVLANILAAAGVEFRIIDKKTGPVRESRAAIIHVRSLELLDKLNIADPVVHQGIKTNRVEVYSLGRPSAEFALVPNRYQSRTPFPYALLLGQHRTEELLVDGLGDRNVEWETELIALADHNSIVAATVRRPGGSIETIGARWVVGADGATSVVRHTQGNRFIGKTYELTGLLADVDISLPSGSTLPWGALRLNLTRGGFVGMAYLGDGLCRLFGAVPPELAMHDKTTAISHEAYATVGLDSLQCWFDDYFFVKAALKRAEWTALYRIHSRIAERFRIGNVFLVGDAAHIHSPAGGQGMNLGIGDAFNLGWKMSLVARGLAHERLLDSYEEERYPIAQAILRNVDRGFALEATKGSTGTWVRDHLATRLVGPLMYSHWFQGLVFKLFSQTWITYRRSSTVGGDLRLGMGLAPGDRAPYGTFEHSGGETTSTFDVFAGPEHCFLLFEGSEPDENLPAVRQGLDELAAQYAIGPRLQLVAWPERKLRHLYGVTKPSTVMLIRPDGHLEYVGSALDLDRLTNHFDRYYLRRPA